MSRLIVRWTFGEWVDKPVHPQMYSLQAAACMWARAVWPEAELVICTNNLRPATQTALEDIAKHVGVTLFDATPYLPEAIPEREPRGKQIPNYRNCWWKFAPLRLDVDAHELILDNDLAMWREPPAIKVWRHADDMLLGEGEWPTEHGTPWDVVDSLSYGNYKSQINNEYPALTYCAGIIGWPPGWTADSFPHPFTEARVRPHFYSNEQGFLALNYVSYDGPKALVGWRDVPCVNENPYHPSWAELRTQHLGAHWAAHNIGRATKWRDRAADALADASQMFDAAVRLRAGNPAPQRWAEYEPLMLDAAGAPV